MLEVTACFGNSSCTFGIVNFYYDGAVTADHPTRRRSSPSGNVPGLIWSGSTTHSFSIPIRSVKVSLAPGAVATVNPASTTDAICLAAERYSDGSGKLGPNCSAAASSSRTGSDTLYYFVVPGTYFLQFWVNGMTLLAERQVSVDASDLTVAVASDLSIKVTDTAYAAKSFSKASTPKVSGTAKVGKKLTAKVGTWSPMPSFAYQWLRNGEAIAGATESGYTLTGADAGTKISVTVTGSKSGYTATSKTSGKAKTVAKGTLVKKTPKITGTAKVGKTLTAKPYKWGPASAGAKLSYQWYRGGKKIKGATTATYELVKADKGRKITVKTTGTATGYTTVTSKASKAVKPKG